VETTSSRVAAVQWFPQFFREYIADGFERGREELDIIVADALGKGRGQLGDFTSPESY
jgi:hypothetical protein